MQVTHIGDHITHAVIGGGAIMEAGVSDDPVFMHMMSSTLYKNQPLAVTREVLCNAWDAHALADCTHLPVQITLDEKHLTIRDFGPGIPHDKIREIYLVYGKSTKKNQKGQTGGFGLGSKSPWAYTDHFEVTSFCEGFRTIYTMTKSSAERAGRPSAVAVARFPSTETGLQVKIPLKEPRNKNTFEKLIKEVVHNGEIKASLNGVALSVFPFSKTESNWLVILKHFIPSASFHGTLYVRYGAVIYPLEDNVSYSSSYKHILSFLNKTYDGYSSNNYAIVFQAPPDSLSITPSREAVSMEEQSTTTIKTMLDTFVKELKASVKIEATALVEENLKAAVSTKNIGALLTDGSGFQQANLRATEQETTPFILKMKNLTRKYLNSNYPTEDGFHHKVLCRRLDEAIKLGAGNKQHLIQFRKMLDLKSRQLSLYVPRPSRYMTREATLGEAWFKRRIVRPLMRDLAADEHLNHKQLYIRASSESADRYGLVPIAKYKRNALTNYFSVLRNVLVITHSRMGLEDRLKPFPELKLLGSALNIFVYVAPLTKAKLPRAREYFAARGFTVLDLTQPQPWDLSELPKDAKPKAPKTQKTKLEGFPALSGAILAGKESRIDNCFLPNASRIVAPVCYVVGSRSRAENRTLEVSEHTHRISRLLVKLYGEKCAVIVSDKQVQTMKKNQVPELTQYALNDIFTSITTQKEFLEYWPDCIIRARGVWHGQTGPSSHLEEQFIFDFPEVRKLLGLSQGLESRERLLLRLWRYMLPEYRYNQLEFDGDLSHNKVREIITKLPKSQTATDIAAKLNNNPMFDAFSGHSLREAYKSTPEDKKVHFRNQMAKIIEAVIKG